MRRLVVSLALLGCRTQPGTTTIAQEAAQPSTVTRESPRAQESGPAREAADRDTDGVPDASDGCPDEPEDRDAFEDEDGCVDRDNDRDEVHDAHEFQNGRWTNCDRMIDNGVEVDCRNRPEDRDGDRDHDGCPDVLVVATKGARAFVNRGHCAVTLAQRVYLNRRGKLSWYAAKRLDAVAAVMAAKPDIDIRIEAHVDERGDDEAARRLTRRVADQVLEELVRRGVARERMEPIGWGDEMPIDRNTTAAGRARNRRVEFEVRVDGNCRPLRRLPPSEPTAGPPGLDCR